MDPIQTTALVRNRMGYSPMPDPSFIQDEGAAAPPAPNDDMIDFVSRAAGDADPERGPTTPYEQSVPRSPLIPEGRTMTVAVNDLMISGREAIFRGQAIELDEQDEQQIAMIILRAAKRRVDSQIQALNNRDASETPRPKGKRGWPKGVKRGPRKPKETPTETPVDAQPQPA